MTDNNPQNRARWKQNTGLAADSTVAQIVCSETDLDTWDDEADHHGFPSRSKYLYTLIQEARAYRRHDIGGPHRAQQRINELEQRIATLQEQNHDDTQQASSQQLFNDPEQVKQYLTDQYQPLPAILQQILESGIVTDLVRQPVENHLYYLAAHNDVVYERGHGWKLAANGGDR